MSTIRQQIINAIVARLAIVRTANGFATDTGANVFKALPKIDISDLPCFNVFPGVEESEREYKNLINTMPVRVEAMQVFTNAQTAADEIETMLGDAIEAMTARQWVMGFTGGGTYEIAVGDTIAGATSGKTALVQAVTVSAGSWAGGDAAGNLTIRRKSGTFQGENLNVGVNLNVATISGTTTASTVSTLVTGGLADDVLYTGGGTEDYPEKSDKTAAVSAVFNILYKTKIGNPFNQ